MVGITGGGAGGSNSMGLEAGQHPVMALGAGGGEGSWILLNAVYSHICLELQ